MQTLIKQVTPVEYDLEIRATAQDLAPDLDRVLREQRTRTNLKGFRKGHVPISVVKKLYGKALAYGVAEKSIQETYEASVLEAKTHDVLGRPKITTLDYEPDGDLFAVIRFGVRPAFELAPTEGVTLSRLAHTVSDADVDEELERIRESRADQPVKEGTIAPDDHVVVNLQRLDEQGLPLIGQKEEGVTFNLGDPRVKEQFRQALIGRSTGDEVIVVMPPSDHDHDHDHHDHDHDHDHDHHDHDHGGRFQVTVSEIREHKLPELDDALAAEVTGGRSETVEQFREEVGNQLGEAWKSRSRELFEGAIVEKMIQLNPVEVPEAVVELYLDSFVEDVKRQSSDSLPDDFDEEAFRAELADEATKQARWMLIRDHVIEQHELKVTDEDRLAFFKKTAGEGDVDPEFLAKYYDAVPGLGERLAQRLMSEKVFAILSEGFDVVDKDREAFEAERAERLEAERIEREAALRIDDPDAGDDKGSWWRRPIDKVWNQWKKPR